MYLIDTNVISEARKGKKANPGVVKFFQSSLAADRYLSVLTIGEIQRGVEIIRLRGDLEQASRLQAWLNLVAGEYANRILNFDVDCARVWGRLMSPHASNPIDKQIASIALIHGLDVVSRNVNVFSRTGVNLLNPFI